MSAIKSWRLKLRELYVGYLIELEHPLKLLAGQFELQRELIELIQWSMVEGAVTRLLYSDSSLDNHDLRSVLSFLSSALESSDWDRRAESASSCVASSAFVCIEIESKGEEEEDRNMKENRYVSVVFLSL